MTDYTYTSRDWLVVFGTATLLLAWWLSFRIVRDRPNAVDLGPHQLK
ncbi:MAG TPA: hypothetical protein VHY91_03360 [Pirellulales bacterium]|jgi:hypothetical protein|nr:hypothetical protein [Pirellulales bacterium]